MLEHPLVSIVTPVFNSSKFLKEMLESVIQQTYKNWELLIVDDFSSDNSVEIIFKIAKNEPRIKLYKLKTNCGAGTARNLAIKNAKGKIIAFLDSDDIWHPKKLELHVAFMLKNKAAFSHTSYGFIDDKSKIIRKTYHVSSKPITYKKALQRTEISCLTAMYDVELVGKIYMPEIPRKQDYALWLTILKNGFNSLPLDIELAWYRQRTGSSTNNKFKLIHIHFIFLSKYMKLSFFSTIKYTTLWIWNGLMKYYF